MLSYLDSGIKSLNKWIDGSREEEEKDKLRKYLEIVTEYRFRISRL